MNNLFLSLFLLLFAAFSLIESKLPEWILGLSALVAGIVVLIGGVQDLRRPR